MIDFEVRGRAVQTIKRSLDVRLRLFKAVNGFLVVSSRCLKGRLSFFACPFQFNYLIPQFFWKQKTIQTLFGFYERRVLCMCTVVCSSACTSCAKLFKTIFLRQNKFIFTPFRVMFSSILQILYRSFCTKNFINVFDSNVTFGHLDAF